MKTRKKKTCESCRHSVIIKATNNKVCVCELEPNCHWQGKKYEKEKRKSEEIINFEQEM